MFSFKTGGGGKELPSPCDVTPSFAFVGVALCRHIRSTKLPFTSPKQRAAKSQPTRRGNMADLNRQLQEYLAQSKSASAAPPQSGSSTALDIGEAPSPEGSWFGRWSAGWSRPAAPSSSWFGSWEPDPLLPGLGRSQRLAAFGLLAGLSALCFGLAALYAPLLLLKARKFALLWSLGSVFALLSAAVLRGPSRLLGAPSPGAALYLLALAGTLYAALGLRSTPLTALGAALQIAAILGSAVALLPGGTSGLRLLGGVAAAALRRTISGRTLPI
ncbi:vesicle transport protein SFT2C [Scleropages formosus]|nr:vesicle transport protein SFT2C [Scleropages formosus]